VRGARGTTHGRGAFPHSVREVMRVSMGGWEGARCEGWGVMLMEGAERAWAKGQRGQAGRQADVQKKQKGPSCHAPQPARHAHPSPSSLAFVGPGYTQALHDTPCGRGRGR
jgi:hypothetical protein